MVEADAYSLDMSQARLLNDRDTKRVLLTHRLIENIWEELDESNSFVPEVEEHETLYHLGKCVTDGHMFILYSPHTEKQHIYLYKGTLLVAE